MTPTEHMVAWIESSREHYERACKLERDRKEFATRRAGYGNNALAEVAFAIVSSAYREATRGGDMFAEQWTPADILESAKALLEWEMEQ